MSAKRTGALHEAERLLTVAVGTFRAAVLHPTPRQSLAHAHEIGNGSLLFVTVVMACIGAILVYQAGVQTARIVPDMTQLGPTYAELLVKDLGPTLCALLLATRVGAGIAAAIGNMVVTEQVDALRLCGTDPVAFLLAPRLFPSIVMTTALVLLSGSAAFGAGAVAAAWCFEVSPGVYADLGLVDSADVTVGLAKCVSYGAAIPIVSGWSGLGARGGSEAVGAVTTRAVVGSSLAVIALDLLISGTALALGAG